MFTHGCSKEINADDPDNTPAAKTGKYLDVELPANGILSEKQLKIFDMAYQRIGECFVVLEDTCFLTTHSAKEFNMSERLFALIEQAVRNANAQYQMYLIFKENNQRIAIKNPFEIITPIPRTKAVTESVTIGIGTTTTTKLSHSEVTTLVNAIRTANGSVSAFSAAISLAFGTAGGVASALISTYAFLKDGQMSKIQDEYAKSGSTSGITLTEITTTSPTTGISTTSYISSINK
nr:hypothetical protein [uncultured Alistipes sp.]